jgi:lipooligosaccharide transport system permease protein
MRWIAVWRRNFLVWRKLFAAAVLTNLADPLIMLFGLGYGLGALMPAVEGMSYISFFAAGQLCTATMYTASFESMFSGFSRMHGQKTWDAILYAPLVIDDIVAGEIIWAASKAWLTGSTILGIVLVFGLAASPLVLLALPGRLPRRPRVLFGRAHHDGARRNWDFFSFYMTLVMTPMMMISGVFFPGGAASRAARLGGEGAAALSRGGAGAPMMAGEFRRRRPRTSRCCSVMLPAATCSRSASRERGFRSSACSG